VSATARTPATDLDLLEPRVLPPDGGLRLQSGPGRDLIFKVTGDETAGLLDYFIVEVAPHGGPPLHVHHLQHETIHVLSGAFKVRIGDDSHRLEEGAFAFLPLGVPHAFLNLTAEPAEVLVTYVPGGGHRFYEELGPLTRNGTPDRAAVAATFEKHGMTLLGPPLTAD
jgi:quercetin dioxygenase-like cupin family protein